jgi:hypothetical protein
VAAAPSLPPGTRVASPELQALARPSSLDSLAAYLDLEGFLRSDLARGLVPGLLVMAGVEAPRAKDCLTRLSTSAREVVIGGDGSGDGNTLISLHLDTGTAHDAMAACVALAGPSAPLPVDKRPIDEGVALTARDQVVIRRGDVVVLGAPSAVRELLDAKPRPWPTELTLAPDSFLAAMGSDDGVSGHAQLTMNATKLLATADITLPSEDKARATAEQAAASLKGDPDDLKGLDEATRAIVTHVRQSIRVDRKDRTVLLALDLEESTATQAKDLGGLAAFAMYGVRQYLTQSKKVEALVAVRSIGGAYRSALEEDTVAGLAPAKKTKRLHSFPAVPRQVPRGETYQTNEADWKAWSEIRFEYPGPQRYQYEIKAAKDGKSADIIARGDLDGDGKTSEIKLHITLDPKTGALDVPTLPTETDGDE